MNKKQKKREKLRKKKNSVDFDQVLRELLEGNGISDNIRRAMGLDVNPRVFLRINGEAVKEVTLNKAK